MPIGHYNQASRHSPISITRHHPTLSRRLTVPASGMASSPALPLVLLALLLAPTGLAASGSGGGGGGEKRTRIRVYVHERFTGRNATVGSVAPSLRGGNSTFGEVGVVDDVLRAGPRASSQEVGRYQGLFAGADLADDSGGGGGYFSAITLVFAAGEHRGSTLSLQGRCRHPLCIPLPPLLSLFSVTHAPPENSPSRPCPAPSGPARPAPHSPAPQDEPPLHRAAAAEQRQDACDPAPLRATTEPGAVAPTRCALLAGVRQSSPPPEPARRRGPLPAFLTHRPPCRAISISLRKSGL